MRHLLALSLVLVVSATARAQTASIAPGMNHVQVVAALGEPVNSRSANGYTYLFYQNSCGRECGMNDLVVLRGDSVVDAIFRSPNRRYTGASSSPEALSPAQARTPQARPARPMEMPKAATTTAAAPQAKAAPAQAIPLRKEVPAAVAPTATTTRTPTAEQLSELRKVLLGSGLTSTQIRAKLREQGYSEHLLDADMRGAAASSQPAVKPAPATSTRPPAP